MKFQDHFTFLHFKKVVAKSIIDEDFRKQLEACDKLYIPDDMYYLLDDTLSAYLGEVAYHSGYKKFYKELLVESFNTTHLPPLSSLITHVMLGYTKRLSIRNNVDSLPITTLTDDITKMIFALLSKGCVENSLFKVLK